MTKIIFLQIDWPTESTSDLDKRGFYIGEIKALDGYLSEGYKVKSLTNLGVNNFNVASMVAVLEK